MNIQLYDINKSLIDLWDNEENFNPETGEMTTEAERKLKALKLGKQQIIKGLGHYYHTATATAEAIAAEIKRLQTLKKTADNKAESIKRYLAGNVEAGEKLNLDTVKVSWRKSTQVEIDPFCNVDNLPAELVKVEKSVRKDAVKNYFKMYGLLPEGISIKENQNLVIQ